MPKTTPRLHLRPLQRDDFARFYAIHADPATNQFNPAGPLTDPRQSEETFEAWLRHWQTFGYGQWAIAERTAPALVIGFGGVAQRLYGDVERLNLGYRFGVEAWGKGYATELATAALAYAFDDLKQPEVFAIVRPAHDASIRVLEKSGMQRLDVLDDVPGQAASLVFIARA
jgi:RimJ/RimL family protein N-acetyltransferase